MHSNQDKLGIYIKYHLVKDLLRNYCSNINNDKNF